jgi:class 3 adenylate cyclase
VDRKLGELRRIKDHFAKFVPEAVKRLVAANPEAPELAKRECDVSVLFLDISGYTRLSEHIAPEHLNALVEHYFSTFLDRIHEVGGDINETAGDGFMTIFQDSTHAFTAVNTALALLAATTALNTENAVQPLTVHMGVNSGMALVGSTRFEGLRGTRWTFTASGAVTNLAARLAGMAKPGEILIGPETAQRLGDRYSLQRLGPEHLKNFAGPIEVYGLRGVLSSRADV